MKGHLLMLVLTLISCPIYAQNAVIEEPQITILPLGSEPIATDKRINNSVNTVGSPSISSSLSNTNAVQLQSSSGASNVSIKLLASQSSVTSKDLAVYKIWSVTAQTPTSKTSSDTNTTLATLDGLANATTVELKYSEVSLNGMTNPKTDIACKQLHDAYMSVKDNKESDFQCDLGTASNLVKLGKLSPASYQEFKSAFFSTDAHVASWGVSAKGGYQDYIYYQPDTLKKITDTKNPWSASAFYSTGPYINAENPWVYTGTINLQSAYKDATSNTRCLTTPPSTGNYFTCASGPIGQPNKKVTEVLNLEVRTKVTGNIGVSLAVSRDFGNNINGVQIPIYFIPSAKDGLTGGVNIGWTSDTHTTTVGVFVGQAFSLGN